MWKKLLSFFRFKRTSNRSAAVAASHGKASSTSQSTPSVVTDPVGMYPINLLNPLSPINQFCDVPNDQPAVELVPDTNTPEADNSTDNTDSPFDGATATASAYDTSSYSSPSSSSDGGSSSYGSSSDYGSSSSSSSSSDYSSSSSSSDSGSSSCDCGSSF